MASAVGTLSLQGKRLSQNRSQCVLYDSCNGRDGCKTTCEGKHADNCLLIAPHWSEQDNYHKNDTKQEP